MEGVPNLFSDNFLGKITNIKIIGIVDSVFKYSTINFIIATIGVYFIDNEYIRYILLSVPALLFMVASFLVIYFAWKAPEYLRSEGYQMTKEVMQIFGDNNNLMSKDKNYTTPKSVEFSDKNNK